MMDRQQIETVVITVLGSVLKTKVDLNSSRQNTAAWDSLKHMEIIFAVEDELGIEFSEEEMTAANSAAKLIELAATSHAA